ncbi:MAG: hypothetical protein A2504_13965 [Bdellovibrionales bacterium RIFOXYD12_FULL_39_22]|nr:MAG: hypothetical protein A2385_00690 [Bdellovibrionales bacterium RIFOXYB1_FULL_39_21]OFZ43807.1 MAG: hypothetical protein A2485_04840 [Bdellovibrionales bacterium RIFOXYC12_FULL_39_17]OFZ48859.1 MAG: hypothetical protein A2404_18005 [Bdellovibrionales bacterium RIFOXYC1_FULL_39_130]OFZ72435.1 MAG: hypothetical protein A2451_13745 [Bdellovibrionales bacterium RIFOXYC2_FULL_39_8]OFZ76592.1 MAG: hypothetical protein A2560_06670 [Bdellovibrionales bacterium RIFOXYD1_FULL_39_84]OFZ94826.1 MAG:
MLIVLLAYNAYADSCKNDWQKLFVKFNKNNLRCTQDRENLQQDYATYESVSNNFSSLLTRCSSFLLNDLSDNNQTNALWHFLHNQNHPDHSATTETLEKNIRSLLQLISIGTIYSNNEILFSPLDIESVNEKNNDAVIDLMKLDAVLAPFNSGPIVPLLRQKLAIYIAIKYADHPKMQKDSHDIIATILEGNQSELYSSILAYLDYPSNEEQNLLAKYGTSNLAFYDLAISESDYETENLFCSSKLKSELTMQELYRICKDRHNPLGETTLFNRGILECLTKKNERYFQGLPFNAESLEEIFAIPALKNNSIQKLAGSNYQDQLVGNQHDFIRTKLKDFLRKHEVPISNYEDNNQNSSLAAQTLITQLPNSNGNYNILIANSDLDFVSANYALKKDGSNSWHLGPVLDDTSWSSHRNGNGLYHPLSVSIDSSSILKILFRIPNKDLIKEEEKNFILVFKNIKNGQHELLRLHFPLEVKNQNSVNNFSSALLPATAPPYNFFLLDGIIKGALVGGHKLGESDERDCNYYVEALAELGYTPISIKNDIGVEEKLMNLIEKKDIDFLIKSAHGNGSDFEDGLYQSCPLVHYYTFTKENNKEMHVLCQPVKCSEKPIYLSYKKFFEALAKRTHPLFYGNIACSSEAKSAFEMASISDLNKLQEISTYKTVTFSGTYFDVSDFDTYLDMALLRMIDNQWNYAKFRTHAAQINPDTQKPYFTNYVVNLPDDPQAIERLRIHIQGQLADGKILRQPKIFDIPSR